MKGDQGGRGIKAGGGGEAFSRRWVCGGGLLREAGRGLGPKRGFSGGGIAREGEQL